jgi:hypothetical protein
MKIDLLGFGELKLWILFVANNVVIVQASCGN